MQSQKQAGGSDVLCQTESKAVGGCERADGGFPLLLWNTVPGHVVFTGMQTAAFPPHRRAYRTSNEDFTCFLFHTFSTVHTLQLEYLAAAIVFYIISGLRFV